MVTVSPAAEQNREMATKRLNLRNITKLLCPSPFRTMGFIFFSMQLIILAKPCYKAS